MKKKARIALFTLVLAVAGIGTSQATLIDRGGGLIYDDVLNITWLQDASYSMTSGANPFGRMTRDDAMAWADGLVYHDSVRNIDWDDWRLPSTINDLSSLGYDLDGSNSELAFMYYVNLQYAPNFEHDRFAPIPTSSAYNPFINLNYRGYWSGTLSPFDDLGWMFHFHVGSTELNGINDEQRVWLVRNGDVTVPEPGTLLLLGIGLIGAELLGRRRAAPKI